MTIAYLVNQYPGLSHSFVRREIQALERLGASIARYAIRPVAQGQLSPEDEAEAAKTTTLTASPKGGLAADAAATLAARPGPSLAMLALALRLGRRSEAGLLKHLFYWAEALILARWLARDGAAHLHAHFGTNSATAAMMAARIAGIPFSITVHGPEEFDKPALIHLREKIRRAAFVAGVSRYGVSQLRRLVPHTLWDRIVEVRCGVDDDFLGAEPAGFTRQSTDFVSVGRLCEQKGQHTLIEAAALLKAQGQAFTLDLIGDGEMRPEIEAAIAHHGLSGAVRLRGWQSPAAVRDALASCKCFVLPSYAEGLPVSIMEAFAVGRPVISTYIAGIPELVRHDENGWLVPAADAERLAEAMKEALDETPNGLRRKGEKGRERTRARHAIDDQARVLLGLFDAARTGRPAAAEGGATSPEPASAQTRHSEKAEETPAP